MTLHPLQHCQLPVTPGTLRFTCTSQKDAEDAECSQILLVTSCRHDTVPSASPLLNVGEEARSLEQKLGIPVLRHSEKKPAGGTASLEDHFGYASICSPFLQRLRHPENETSKLWLITESQQSTKGITILCCRCSSSKLIMIGDRYLTDIVYGNRHGMLTIRPSPLTLKGEPRTVQLVSRCQPS